MSAGKDHQKDRAAIDMQQVQDRPHACAQGAPHAALLLSCPSHCLFQQCSHCIEQHLSSSLELVSAASCTALALQSCVACFCVARAYVWQQSSCIRLVHMYGHWCGTCRGVSISRSAATRSKKAACFRLLVLAVDIQKHANLLQRQWPSSCSCTLLLTNGQPELGAFAIFASSMTAACMWKSIKAELEWGIDCTCVQVCVCSGSGSGSAVVARF